MTISHNGTEVPVTPQPIISLIGLLERLTDAEWISIEMGALDNPTDTNANRKEAARIRVKLRRIVASADRGIDLSKPWVSNFFTRMETAGFLAAGRVAQIVDQNITPDERI